jgi:hypothetical protein
MQTYVKQHSHFLSHNDECWVMQCLQHCPADAEELLNQLYPAIHMSGSRWLIVSGVSLSAVFVSPPRIIANGVDAAVLDATTHRVTVQ